MKKTAAAILYLLVRIVAFVPMPLLYFFSDILICPLLHYVVRYRLWVVRSNMKRCFPDKGKSELRRMERRFYRQFCDNVQEMIHMAGMGRKEAMRRSQFEGVDMLCHYLESGRNVLLYASHYADWEYQAFFNLQHPEINVYSVYRPLENGVMDLLVKKIRSRFGAVPVSKRLMTRTLYEAGKTRPCGVFCMVSDQYAAHDKNCYLMTFLGQENTHVINGVERLARHTDAVVVYNDVVRVSRGHYKTVIRLVTDDANSLPEHEITARYLRMMEQTILRAPEYWLWSHKRWK